MDLKRKGGVNPVVSTVKVPSDSVVEVLVLPWVSSSVTVAPVIGLPEAAVPLTVAGIPTVNVMLSALFTLCGGVPESVAVTVKFVVPAVVGVPEIVPELLNVSPAGGEPEVMLQVWARPPPEATTEAGCRPYPPDRWAATSW